MGQCHSAASSTQERRRHGTDDDEEESSTSSGLKKRCVAMAKEQRSRFYILRRCIVMLLCWHKYNKYQLLTIYIYIVDVHIYISSSIVDLASQLANLLSGNQYYISSAVVHKQSCRLEDGVVLCRSVICFVVCVCVCVYLYISYNDN